MTTYIRKYIIHTVDRPTRFLSRDCLLTEDVAQACMYDTAAYANLVCGDMGTPENFKVCEAVITVKDL